ncbi:hypothetical protein K491DRAFT_690652 [Lophiostoma macrostomum CBS 122681]|uniref:BZIP domain-containing protein n=1 Tax=Lophiostoma macrostomum CBS 122681 TaxID=1314788 RepID=A0A6A6TEQ0_9PLEO|nr:hypothetical protein K491DRAFT_690652 [Lophiostoma macrostomum CBS 122681]
MPAQKRKTKTPEDVPGLGDPERKRVLNVLAQRRYRQRRREKLAELEAKANTVSPPTSTQHQNGVPFQVITPERTSGSSSEEISPECNAEDYVEEVFRNPSDMSFPHLEFNQEPLDFTLFQDFGFANLPSPNPSTPELFPPNETDKQNETQPQVHLPSQSQSQSLSTHPPAFALPMSSDGGQLDVPIFNLMRTFATIATSLNVISHIYEPLYTHVLSPTPHSSLPANLHPTAAQTSIPHHPLLDTLPWPSVRDKLICMFALPSCQRPAIAQDDEGLGPYKGIWQIAQDLDDDRDGMRVHGNSTRWGDGNELVEESWEIGELFYRNWWWALDGRVVEISNRRRKERGLGVLRLVG